MKWCDRDLIRNPLYMGLCLSEKAYLKEIKRMGIKNPPDFLKNEHCNATAHFFVSGGKESVIVCLGEHKERTLNSVYGLLAHEAVHVWQAIRDTLGEVSPSSEFEAYSIQMLSQQLWWAYDELVAKKKKNK